MNTQYIDITWLSTFGLTLHNVMEYFYTSPFYDPTSNNETFRIQGITSNVMVTHLTNGKTTGIEFALDAVNSKEPHLFVIKKQNRNRNSVDVLEVYYCLDGIIYQSPLLLDLLRNRIAKVAFKLKRSFDEIDSAVQKQQSESGLTGSKLIKFPRSDKESDDSEKSKTVVVVAEGKKTDNSSKVGLKYLLEDIRSVV